MADEVKAGDVLSYTVRGVPPPIFGSWTWLDVANCVADTVMPALEVTTYPLATSDRGLTINLKALMNRSHLSDIKYDLDSSLRGRCLEAGAVSGVSSTLVVVSRALVPSSGGNNQQTPGASPNAPPGTPPPPPGQKLDMFDELAKQLGIKKDMIWWGLGGIALLLVMRK